MNPACLILKKTQTLCTFPAVYSFRINLQICISALICLSFICRKNRTLPCIHGVLPVFPLILNLFYIKLCILHLLLHP